MKMRNHISKSLLLCLLVLASLVICQSEDVEESQRRKIEWDPNLPTLSVGDFYFDNGKDFQDFKISHQIFVLAVSDSSCEKWCQGEIVVNELNRMFKNGQVQYQGSPIPIVRVDLQKYQGEFAVVDVFRETSCRWKSVHWLRSFYACVFWRQILQLSWRIPWRLIRRFH